MNNVQQIALAKTKSNRLLTKIVAGTSMAVASVSSFAVDHTAAITAAGADGTTNVTAAATVVIAIMAVITGIGFIVKLLGK